MPRPRTPVGKAELTGAAAQHPERYKGRANPQATGPLGAPPKFLTAGEKKAWKDFAQEWSWLTAQDRPAMVALVQMRTGIEDPGVQKTAAMYTAYRLMLSEFGGTPVSRSKITEPGDEEEDDPFAAFGGTAH